MAFYKIGSESEYRIYEDQQLHQIVCVDGRVVTLYYENGVCVGRHQTFNGKLDLSSGISLELRCFILLKHHVSFITSTEVGSLYFNKDEFIEHGIDLEITEFSDEADITW